MANIPHNKFTEFEAFILIASIIFFSYCIIAPKVREHKKEAERAKIELQRDLEIRRAHEALIREIEEQRKRDSIEAPMRRIRDSIAKAQIAEQDVLKKRHAE